VSFSWFVDSDSDIEKEDLSLECIMLFEAAHRDVSFLPPFFPGLFFPLGIFFFPLQLQREGSPNITSKWSYLKNLVTHSINYQHINLLEIV